MAPIKFLSSGFPNIIIKHSFLTSPLAAIMLHPLHHPWFGLHNNIWWRVRHGKLLLAIILQLLLLLVVLLLSSSSSSPLCRVSIHIFPRQTMSLGDTLLQLFCLCYHTMTLEAWRRTCPKADVCVVLGRQCKCYFFTKLYSLQNLMSATVI
jgi:hypothetical protein